jgi:hypothetical protein
MIRRRKVLNVFLVFLILSYPVSYIWRSLQGRYEPALIGLNGVKVYGWAPRGFVDDYKWRRGIRLVYAPLSFIDDRLWHRPLLPGETTSYPINESRLTKSAKFTGQIG